jgi:hypothetical protein
MGVTRYSENIRFIGDKKPVPERDDFTADFK